MLDLPDTKTGRKVIVLNAPARQVLDALAKQRERGAVRASGPLSHASRWSDCRMRGSASASAPGSTACGCMICDISYGVDRPPGSARAAGHRRAARPHRAGDHAALCRRRAGPAPRSRRAHRRTAGVAAVAAGEVGDGGADAAEAGGAVASARPRRSPYAAPRASHPTVQDVARGAAHCRAMLAEQWARNTTETPALRSFVERSAAQRDDINAQMLWTYFTTSALYRARLDELEANHAELTGLRAESERLERLLQIAGGRNTPHRPPPYAEELLTIARAHRDRLQRRGGLTVGALARALVDDARAAQLIPPRRRSVTPRGQASYSTMIRWARKVQSGS